MILRPAVACSTRVGCLFDACFMDHAMLVRPKGLCATIVQCAIYECSMSVRPTALSRTLGRCVFGVSESLVDVCATIVGRFFNGYAMTVRRSVHARLMIARRSAMLVLRTLLSPSRVRRTQSQVVRTENGCNVHM